MNPPTVPPAIPLERYFQAPGRTLVALSGGVDSAVLLALTARVNGRSKVSAVTTFSAAVPAEERASARRVAAHVGVDHDEVETRELENPEYRGNTGDRCYHCRIEMFDHLIGIARARGFDTVSYGAIVDDLGDDRPGMRAAEEYGIRAPLIEAGLTKLDVRALARDLGLPVSDKPATACLASRIPVGTPVTAERLAQVERAERAVARLGFRQFRVRHHGDVARLELDENGSHLLRDDRLRQRLIEEVRAAGFRFVAVDLEGYRSGSLNLLKGEPAETESAPATSSRPAGRAGRGSPRRSG
ncbi:MAG: ATP-dependent sacrificial sulfur transferase LarE [Acidobacteria bacterium]|nr:ATP-dependent sacrificial sulfur transferase LarE [Acidobacteriota bacterium]NIM60102.1 ATP-dependent sacrificial sulfur transferase LarE [Acidobacteriota bacterium]NIO59460.1 ATP-dependent sacrificial sulfur transferase LarE [Acidobacteriota bacterium]NIQ30491.1 ATP-dependent sacrificial sulfur transferase LarE [Acidobacteriota bacterium]NIQ85430.1 ATP-dependent sacrificial sulfur transferase LarE [Acidobacteriota bacterium]